MPSDQCDCGADSWDFTSGAWQCWGCLYDARHGGAATTTADEADVTDEAHAAEGPLKAGA